MKIAIPVQVDSRYRIVIPKEIREELQIEVGSKWMIEYDYSGEEKLLLIRIKK